jgi:hypothetical protein
MMELIPGAIMMMVFFVPLYGSIIEEDARDVKEYFIKDVLKVENQLQHVFIQEIEYCAEI